MGEEWGVGMGGWADSENDEDSEDDEGAGLEDFGTAAGGLAPDLADNRVSSGGTRSNSRKIDGLFPAGRVRTALPCEKGSCSQSPGVGYGHIP